MNYESNLSGRMALLVGDNVSAFAKKCGVGEGSLRQYLDGAKPGLLKAAAIAEAAGVTLDWLATGKESSRPGVVNEGRAGYRAGRLVPLFERWQEVLAWVHEGALPKEMKRLEAPVYMGSRGFALPVRGRIMAPLFPAGARIFVDPDLPAETDSFVIIQVEGWDEATFRRLVMDAGRTRLEPIDPAYRTVDLTGETYTYCGRVVRMEQDLV